MTIVKAAQNITLFMMLISTSSYGAGVTFASCNAGATHINGSSACTIATSAATVESLPYIFKSTNLLNVGADAGLDLFNGSGTPGSSVVSASDTEILFTAGSPRLGFAEFYIYNQDIHGGTSEGSLSDGVHDYSVGTCPNLDFVGCGYRDSGYPRATITLPFDLGTEFFVSGSASASLFFPTASGPAAQDAQTVISFNLFEADGVTPVNVSFAAPEPSTLLLMLLSSLVVLPFLAFRSRRIS